MIHYPKVAQSLFRMATQGKSVAPAIFWMKARAGWREKHEIVVAKDDVSLMSDEELARELDRLMEGHLFRPRDLGIRVIEADEVAGDERVRSEWE